MPGKHVGDAGAVASQSEASDSLVAAVRSVENDCEDQGFSDVKYGCNRWPCNRQPLIKAAIGWRCTKCGGSY